MNSVQHHCSKQQKPATGSRVCLPLLRSRPAGYRVRFRPVVIVGLRLGLVAGLLLVAVHGAIAFATRDPLWFMSRFDAEPIQIIVYHDGGQQTSLYPGHPDFQPLARAIHECLSRGLDGPSRISFSEASLRDAYTRYLTVEAFFYGPVKLHAWFETPSATRMLFPITGQHSDLPLVVLASDDQYLPSPPALNTIEPLRQALNALGYY